MYPYLRYGLIIARESTITSRVFTHNEACDFCVAAAAYAEGRLHELLKVVLTDEIAASRRLDDVTAGRIKTHLFRTEVVVDVDGARE